MDRSIDLTSLDLTPRLTGIEMAPILMSSMDTKKRLTVTLDRGLLEEARRLTGLTTLRQTVARALAELVRSERRRALAHSLGKGAFATSEAALQRRRRRDLGR